MLLPLITLVYPIFKLVPPAYNWRMKSRINRWYKKLRQIELSMEARPALEEIRRRVRELDRIERVVRRLSMPASYGDSLYTLRGHIVLLRDELWEAAAGRAGDADRRVSGAVHPDPEGWLERARRTRGEARDAADPLAQRTLKEVAERYERLAGQAQGDRQGNEVRRAPAE